jgi:signal transduction histidine kinase
VRWLRGTARPIAEVMEAADRVAEGDYDVRVEASGARDVRRLAHSFNQMSERLASNEARRRELLADVAHELRTPLSVIRGNVEGMLDGLYPADEAHLRPVLERTTLMARLLDDLQTLSTAEAGALRLHPEPTDPGGLVRDAVEAFRAEAEGAGVSLGARVEPGVPTLEVDPVRIAEVLANLISNALRATPRGGVVEVVVEPEAAGTAFWVRDTGSGIPADQLPHVFERFVRSADSGGAGLGLAIARTLVQAHGGTISAVSEQGRGATMRFVLPLTGS